MINPIKDWQAFVEQMNSKGIPLPTARDPKTHVGSLTYSLVLVSASLCTVSILIMLGTCLARLKSDFVLNPETSAQIHDAFMSSFTFFMGSLGAYLGRKMQKDPLGGLIVSADKPDDDDKW